MLNPIIPYIKKIFVLNIVFAVVPPIFFFMLILPSLYASGDYVAAILTELLAIAWYGLIGGILVYFSSVNKNPSAFFILPMFYVVIFGIVWIYSTWISPYRQEIIIHPNFWDISPIIYFAYLPAVVGSFTVKIAVSLFKRMAKSV